MRYRTTARPLSGSGARQKPQEDRRIQRSRHLLHEALGSLIREKSYDRITVAEILARAQVSRSTFYIHFRDKDDLLTGSMRELLLGALALEPAGAPGGAERIAAFSLPLLTHIDRHRRTAMARLGERGRALLHEHLRQVLAEWIRGAMREDPRRGRARRTGVAPDLLARHIASTFILALHWWLDQGAAASVAEANGMFRALVMPVLTAAY